MHTEKEIKNTPLENQAPTEKAIEKEPSGTIVDHDAEDTHHHEDDHDHEEGHHESVDYSHHTKEELAQAIEHLLQEGNLRKVDHELRQMRPFIDHIKEDERAEALRKFISEGGEEGDFEYRYDEHIQKFENTYRQLRDKRKKQLHDLEKDKEKNLEAKNAILEKLRSLVEGEETNTSMNALKKIQEEWKSIGPIPAAFAKDVYANYSVLLDRFYNNRSIYFELKELDRKKNLEHKKEIIEKAEKLLEQESFNKAVKELNELHDEYKHIGPVPKEEQETLWTRFKEISDQIYSKRREYIEVMKSELESNWVAKTSLAEQAQAFSSFDSDRIDDWNSKSQEIMELQNQWKSIGGMPRNKSDEVTKKFWGSLKQFFNNKSAFFRKIEDKRNENLRLKTELCEKAEALKDSEDFDATAETLKDLQQSWKTIGSVPNKFKNSIYERFKAALDHFFDRKRAQHSENEAGYKENLKKKATLCERIEKAALTKTATEEELQAFWQEWDTIGFVPRKDMASIQKRYQDAINAYIDAAEGMDDTDKMKFKLMSQVSQARGGGGDSHKNLQKQEFGLRKKIQNLEADISLWKNNMEFFANSKNADALKADFVTKIEKAEAELDLLKQQIKIIHQM
jgi:hypothetical protein